MATLPIVIYPAPILKRPAKPVATITDATRRILADMAETMYAAPGVGLAAPQVGVASRLCVVDVGEPVPSLDRTESAPTHAKLYQLINPAIVERSEELVDAEEGCLSIPHFRIVMRRHAIVTVRATDPEGRRNEVHGHGLLSVALQHENDHLDGKLIIDSLSQLKQEQYLRQMKQPSRDHEAGEL
ncbi:MAG: peptide deformylase [Deltaproteobacteria bacterium]|nr:peptide deformylase [Deltaproteobacteria bacterium]